jgi:hypothetical protein
MMPFFVSSFAALIKDQHFVLVFHPTWLGNLPPLVAGIVWAALVVGVKMWARTRTRSASSPPTT